MLGLPGGRVGGDPVGGDVDGLHAPEGDPEVVDRILDAIQRPLAVGLIVVDDHLGQVVKGGTVTLGPDERAGGHVP